jgi:glycosyltransferase involved in cell wall biosynthesis
MEISFVVSTRNNLKYLKWSYDSIRKNQGNHTVWLCYGVDSCNDGTQEWIQEIRKTDLHVLSIENPTENQGWAHYHV